MKISSIKKMIKHDGEPTPVAPVKKVATKKVAAKKAAPKVAKKATKVATKKAPAKKVATKKSAAPRPLVVSSDSESFWVTSGQVLNSLLALEEAFDSMPETVYSYHTSSTGSDFADWVEAVLMAPDCASLLRKAKTAKAAHAVVVKHLKVYKL